MRGAYSVVVATATWIALSLPARAGESPSPLDEARQKLATQDGRAAVLLFEEALPGATEATRPEILEGLRAAYPLAIQQAESRGDHDSASIYREHLAILTRNSKGSTRREQAQTSESPPTNATDQPVLIKPPSAPMPLSTEWAESIGMPTKESVSQAAVQGVSQEASSPAPVPEPSVETSDASTSAPQADHSTSGLAEQIAAADAAFLAKRYKEAGLAYARLAESGQLPEIRRDPWAYCRMVEVVRQINEGPRTTAQWKWIHEETQAIRNLCPQNWYAEYLRNLAAEMSTQGRRSGTSGMLVRGASPEEPRPGGQNRPAIRTPQSSAYGVEDASQDRVDVADQDVQVDFTDVVGKAGPRVNDWEVWETPNFRIYHKDEPLAMRVARIAETVRMEQCTRWTGEATSTDWDPRCDVYLYPSAKSFSQMTGQPAESPGFSTMALNAGKVTVRRVNLRADHENLLKAVLPHEVTHIVLADLFPSIQIPRWADEGMAVLAEPSSEQDLRAADLVEPLASNRLFKVSDLMTMDYPDPRHWALYYAQSVSLTRFLVEQKTPRDFIEFVRTAQKHGFESELQRVYGISGFDDLQARWQQHAATRITTIASRGEGGDPRSDETAARR